MAPHTETVDTQKRAARILVVDDDAVVTESLGSLLKLETDYEIIECHSALDAVRILRESSVDVIITDFLMPQMNGLQLLAEAKRLHPDIPRILLTGYADKENAIRAINEVGIFQFVEKPWDNEQLLLVIQNAIHTKRLQETLTERIHELDEVLLQRSRLEEHNEIVREELRQAQQLQQSMLPETLPSGNGLVMTAAYEPALEIGGDFYDTIPLADDKIAVLVADATGHGIPAALSTAVVKFAFRQFSHDSASATEIIEGMNNVLYRALPADTFVAGAVAVIDPLTARITLVNAGLPHPYRVRRSTKDAEIISTEGFMLGVIDASLYETAEEVSVTLESGDKLVLYTDGLSEAENGNGEQFDDHALQDTLAAQTQSSCNDLCKGLVQAGREFSGDGHAWDDVTVLAIGRK